MAEPLYACSRCGADARRDQLTSKKVMFAGIGNESTVFRSRIVDWLCENCLGADTDYNYPKDMSRRERMNIARSRRKASRANATANSQG